MLYQQLTLKRPINNRCSNKTVHKIEFCIQYNQNKYLRNLEGCDALGDARHPNPSPDKTKGALHEA